MAESAVCTADVLAAAHRKLGGQVPCQDLCAIWAAVGAEIAQQLLKRRGILLRDLGAVVVTARGVSLLAAAAAPRGGTPDSAAKDLGVRVSRETVAKCVAAVVGELLRCAERKQRTSLALRPVGLFEVAGRAGAGGVSLIVDAAFAEGVARAWDSNLAARPRDYSSQRTGFRPDDREHAATSRQAAAPPRYDAVAGKRQASPATLRNGAGAAALRAKLVARHGDDGLCVLARALASVRGGSASDALRCALQDCDVGYVAAEIVDTLKEAGGDSATVRTVERAVAGAAAASARRRDLIDDAWRELVLDSARGQVARLHGAAKDGGGVEMESLGFGFLNDRIDAAWHAHVRHGNSPEDYVVFRLLSHFEMRGRVCDQRQWRAMHARLSAAYANDADFEATMRACWKLRRTALKGAVDEAPPAAADRLHDDRSAVQRPQRRQIPRPTTAWTFDGAPTDNDGGRQRHPGGIRVFDAPPSSLQDSLTSWAVPAPQRRRQPPSPLARDAFDDDAETVASDNTEDVRRERFEAFDDDASPRVDAYAAPRRGGFADNQRGGDSVRDDSSRGGRQPPRSPAARRPTGRSKAAMIVLRNLVYTPPCDASELARRLGGSFVKTDQGDVMSTSDFARRLAALAEAALPRRGVAPARGARLGARRAARLAGACADAAGHVALQKVHADLCASFGPSTQTRTKLFARALPRLADLRARLLRARGGLDARLDAKALHQALSAAGVAATPHDVRREVDGLAGARNALLSGAAEATISAGDVLNLVRGGPMPHMRRSMLVALHAALSERCDRRPPTAAQLLVQRAPQERALPQQRAPLANAPDLGDARAAVPVGAFVDLYEDTAAAFVGDYDFSEHLRAAWDVDVWPDEDDDKDDEDDDDGAGGRPVYPRSVSLL